MVMSIQSLNADVLCHLMTYLEPVDRFNLVLSGMLMDIQVEGTEQFVRKRNRGFGIDSAFFLHRGRLTFRDLKMSGCYKSGRALFDLLIKSGVLENLRHLDVKYYFKPKLGLVKSICSFKHLETLSMKEKTIEWRDVAQVFQHCPKLSQLTSYVPRGGVNIETYQNQVRPGIQKLDSLILLAGENNSTYSNNEFFLGDVGATHLHIDRQKLVLSCQRYSDWFTKNKPVDPRDTQIADWQIRELTRAVDRLIRENKNIEIFNLPDPTIAEAILQLINVELLKKLKQLNTVVHKASHLKMVLAECWQMEVLRAQINEEVAVSEFAYVFESGNIRELQLVWNGPSVKEVLPVFQRWEQLNKLSLKVQTLQSSHVPIKELYKFVMELKHLNYFELTNDFDFEEIEKFKDLVTAQRPHFVCKINAAMEKL